MRPRPVLLSAQRRARSIAWARLAFVWAAAALFGALDFKRRHIRQRYGWLDLGKLIRFVCHLALIRAAELAPAPCRVQRAARPAFAPAGFRRRVAPANLRRAAIGARLRRYLRHADGRVRIERALEALADLDACARRFLVRRALRRLTRLCPLAPARPPAQRFASAPAPAPQFADSS
jgi:hypothetical protein